MPYTPHALIPDPPQGVDLGAVNAGAVFVHSADGEPIHQLLAIEQSMRFGSALSQAEDFNGDGLLDLAVGALGANNGQGAVFVYWNASSLTAFSPSDADVIWNGVFIGVECLEFPDGILVSKVVDVVPK